MAYNYYRRNKKKLLSGFDREAAFWLKPLTNLYGKASAARFGERLRGRFETFIVDIPCIGGSANRRTLSLIDAARCLVFYLEFRDLLPVIEIGRILFEAVVLRQSESASAFTRDERYTPEQVTAYRRYQAELSHRRRYPDDYLYDYIPPESGGFLFGYDFHECGAMKLYGKHDALAFLPFYCYLDFPKMIGTGQRLERDKTLSLGDPLCNHRFLQGEPGEIPWPPPFSAAGG